MDNGWVKLHRKLTDWEWFKDSKTLHLFIYLLVSANHKPNKWKGITIERGQILTGLHSLKYNTGISLQSVRTSLFNLKSTNEITIKSTNRYSIITICNYNTYQDDKKEINQPSNKPTNKQLTNNQQTTNNKQECKEVKNNTIIIDKPVKEPQNPNIKIFIDYAFETYKVKTGSNLFVAGGKDGKLIKSALSTFSLDSLKALWDAFLKSEDAFVLENGYSIGIFVSQINKITSKEARK